MSTQDRPVALVIQHLLHPHTLSLSNPPSFPGFKCNGCNQLGQGFRYRCDSCDFDLHCACAWSHHPPPVMRVIDHPLHVHPVRLSNELYDTFQCNNCRLLGQGTRFQCTSCSFDMHDACAFASTHSFVPIRSHSVAAAPLPNGLGRGFAVPLPAAAPVQQRGIGSSVTRAVGGILGRLVMNAVFGGSDIDIDFND
ncbi:hypothetical protein Droror1_Dr00005804 [Drosera rotundifolia]